MKKNQKIKVRARVHVGEKLVDVDTLSPDDRRRLANALQLEYFNALYAGKAVFKLVEEPES